MYFHTTDEGCLLGIVDLWRGMVFLALDDYVNARRN